MQPPSLIHRSFLGVQPSFDFQMFGSVSLIFTASRFANSFHYSAPTTVQANYKFCFEPSLFKVLTPHYCAFHTIVSELIRMVISLLWSLVQLNRWIWHFQTQRNPMQSYFTGTRISYHFIFISTYFYAISPSDIERVKFVKFLELLWILTT